MANFLIVQSSLIPDPKLYVWDIENDAVIFFNFASGKNDQVNASFLGLEMSVYLSKSQGILDLLILQSSIGQVNFLKNILDPLLLPIMIFF